MEEPLLACEIEEPPGKVKLTHQKRTNSNGLPEHIYVGNTVDYSYNHTVQHNTTIEKHNNHRLDHFRKKWFPQTTNTEWNDWKWQLQNRLETFYIFNKVFRLSEKERDALLYHHDTLPVAITPYYASLLDKDDSFNPLRKAMIPIVDELTSSPGESADPLTETEQSPVPGIIHRYPDRVLFLTTNLCACYCRYCTRSRIVGQCLKKHTFTRKKWMIGINYIASHPEIRDVLISGGDPLILPDTSLEWILKQLRQIKHIQILRIGTKAPVVLPQRITPSLVNVLKQYHPLWLSIHFTHPDELTPEVKNACERLSDAGIPLGSQTVLLAGINDDPLLLRTLFHRLLTMRVRPYYLYQCDPIIGSSHFRTQMQKGIDIIHSLHGFTTGYAVPHYVIDAPGGGGKIPISPNYIIGYKDDTFILNNYLGKKYYYPDTAKITQSYYPQKENIT